MMAHLITLLMVLLAPAFAFAQQVQVDVNEAVGSCSETELLGTWKLVHLYQNPEGASSQAFEGGYIDYLVFSEGLNLKFFTTQDSFSSPKQVEVRLIEVEEQGAFIPHRFRLGKNDVVQMTRNGQPVQYFRCNMLKMDLNEKMMTGDMILNSSVGEQELMRVFRKL